MSFRAVSRTLRGGAATCQRCSSSANARAAGANMLRATPARQLSTRASPMSPPAGLSPVAMALGGASVGTVLYLATKSQRNAIALDSAPAPQRGSASDRLKPRPAPQPIRRKVEEARDEVQALDDEDSPAHASQQSAFDPETNTINWDCPCLGGMADGPCGEQFKEAFSCFVFSDSEVKGIECVDRFKAMQDCFRQYPEHYKEEIEDEERVEAESAEELEASIKKEDQSEA